jgi:hypothetical protein
MAMLSFRMDDKFYWVIYDKNKQTACTIDKLIDDYHTDTPISIFYGNGPFIMDNEYLYFFLQPEQLIVLMKKKEQSNAQYRENILDLIYHSPSFSEQSNVILVKCKFKKL